MFFYMKFLKGEISFSWMKNFVFWLEFHWRLFIRVHLTINQRQAIIWTNADAINWRIYAALGWDGLNYFTSLCDVLVVVYMCCLLPTRRWVPLIWQIQNFVQLKSEETTYGYYLATSTMDVIQITVCLCTYFAIIFYWNINLSHIGFCNGIFTCRILKLV